MCIPMQIKKFQDNIIHFLASDTVLKMTTWTILTQGNAVRIFNPGNIERFLRLDATLSMDHFLTPSFSVNKYRETFGELGYSIQCLETFFAGFLLEKFKIAVVVIVLWRFEIGKFSGVSFGVVRTMQGAIFELFILSQQTPMYISDKNKTNYKLRVQKTIVNETFAAQSLVPTDAHFRQSKPE